MKNNSFYGFLVMVIVAGLFSVGCLSLGGSGVKVISNYQTAEIPMEQHARIYIGNLIDVVGVDNKMSPMKVIASGGNVILLAPGNHTLNVCTWDSSRGRNEPPYPGYKMTFTVETGKYYRVSTTGARSGLLYNNTTFSIEEFDNSPENDALKAKIEEALNKTKGV